MTRNSIPHGKALEVRSYNHAVVVPYGWEGGGVYVDGKLLSNTQLHRDCASAKSLDQIGEIEDSPDVAVYLGCFYRGWGHALTDCLKHLWCLSEEHRKKLPVRKARLVYILGRSDERSVEGNPKLLLESVGVDFSVAECVSRPMRFKRIYVPDESFWLEKQGDVNHRVFTDEYRQTIDSIEKKYGRKECTGKTVYFSRKQLNLKGRESGEPEVERAIVEGFGCDAISPESLALPQLVELLSSCKRLITTEGSIAHNAVFLPRGAELVILRKADYTNSYQRAVNELRQLNVTHVDVFKPDTVKSKTPWIGPFRLCVTDDLVHYLKNCGAADCLKLNYYMGNPNFGDALAKPLIERLSGRRVAHGTCYESQIMAVGSVFGDGSRFVAGVGKAEADISDRPLVVWGSGFLEPKIPDGDLVIRRKCDIRAVRGIHTRDVLVKCGLLEQGTEVALGDPGLFYPDLVPDCRGMEKIYDLALVPHVLDRGRAVALKGALGNVGLKVVLVDVMQANPLACVREIAAAKKVIASSLHALIVADSLGIPNRRLKFAEFFKENDKRHYDQSDFKFKDYYSAFGMNSPGCITEDELLKDPLAVVESITELDVVAREKVEACKRGLLAAFPLSMKDSSAPRPVNTAPKLSIIIPVFNAEMYLHECLASVLTQDAFEDLEVICIDDGSKDSSKDILAFWAGKDARVKVLSQTNQGPGGARNAGLAVAKGEYIAFLDADDRLTCGLNLKDAFDYAVANDLDVEVLASNRGPDENGKWLDSRELKRELVPSEKIFAPEVVGINLFLFTGQGPCAKLYHRDFITAHGLRFPTLKRSEDFPFVMSSLLLSRKIGVLDVPLCDYRRGVSTSLESTKDETPCIFLEAMDWFCKSVDLPYQPEWVKSAFRISQTIRYAYNLRSIHGYCGFKQIVACLSQETDEVFRLTEDCRHIAYMNAYNLLSRVRKAMSDECALVELFVDIQTKKGLNAAIARMKADLADSVRRRGEVWSERERFKSEMLRVKADLEVAKKQRREIFDECMSLGEEC